MHNALPDQVDQIESLCEKDDELLKPHAKASPPRRGRWAPSCASKTTASTALRMVPRLQKKHYEMIPSASPKSTPKFSHMTAIVAQAPENLAQLELEEWKGKEEGDEANSFDAAWQQLTDAQRAAVEALQTATRSRRTRRRRLRPSLPIASSASSAAMAALVTVKRSAQALRVRPQEARRAKLLGALLMHTVAIS